MPDFSIPWQRQSVQSAEVLEVSPVPSSCRWQKPQTIQPTSKIASTSTVMFPGKLLTPIADRACLPASPKTSTSKSEHPLIFRMFPKVIRRIDKSGEFKHSTHCAQSI